jgi:hypothetical protein
MFANRIIKVDFPSEYHGIVDREVACALGGP